VTLAAPFPWFGGKSRVAPLIWDRFGAVDNYVEPFFGSGAVLLARPNPRGVETINDADGFVANFWRAVRAAPQDVAHWADWPVSEADLHARHYWLVTEGRDRLAPLLGNPDGYDAQVAGWWVWGLCSWIGGGWCSGEGPWRWDGAEWVNGTAGQGINRQLPHMGTAGQGINRQLPHMGTAGQGINRKLPHMGAGRGINRQLPHMGTAGQGILDWMERLAARLRRVRIAHGDWSRVVGDSVTWRHGTTAVFLDPPYSMDERAAVYAVETDAAAAAREWAIEAGKRPDMRICLAGYDGEHAMPPEWAAVRWKAKGGYGSQGQGRGRDNATRETLWFSPACQPAVQEALL
jgi:DNA adenine methylase